jgi:IS5 family transposase
MHKSWGGGPPLGYWQRRHNSLIAPIRASVETVFAVLKRRMGYTRARYRGLSKNLNHFLLLAIAYNMRRASALAA